MRCAVHHAATQLLVLLLLSLAIGCSPSQQPTSPNDDPRFSMPGQVNSGNELFDAATQYLVGIQNGFWNHAYPMISTRCQSVWTQDDLSTKAIRPSPSMMGQDIKTKKLSDADAVVLFPSETGEVTQRWKHEAGGWRFDDCDSAHSVVGSSTVSGDTAPPIG